MVPRNWNCSQVTRWLLSFNKNQQVLNIFTTGSYPTFRKLFQHLQYVHNGQSNFKVRCELGPLCGTRYTNFKAYKAHVYREHVNLLDEDLCKQEVQFDTGTHTNKVSLSTYDDAQLHFGIQENDLEDNGSENEGESDDETSFC
ncbi:unnamed protein product [Rotaria sp. Silwood1]|nr:unnamed protein product [Rotaria sp. Silwood1]